MRSKIVRTLLASAVALSMATASKASSQEKVRAYRTRLRAQGLRPIQFWVPDVRSDSFRAEAQRQSRAVAASPREQEDQSFIDAVADWPDS